MRVLFFSVSEGDGEHPRRNLRPKSIITEVENSLIRLQTDYIDLLQCHWPDPSFPISDTMSAFVHLHEAGKIRAVGVSNFDPHQLQDAQDALGDIPLASTQPRYSLMNRLIEADVVPWLQANSVGAIVYSPISAASIGKVTPDRFFQTTTVAQAIRSSAQIEWLFQTPLMTSLISPTHTMHLRPLSPPHGASISLVLRQLPSVHAPSAGHRKCTPLKSAQS